MPKSADRSRFKRLTRRELLKLSPVVLLGAFAWPRTRSALLHAGESFNDWAESKWYRPDHPATTFSDSQALPLERFPFNGYDVLEPEIDFAVWKLEVTGLVKRPGGYPLDQIQSLPKMVQNTRHVCVEGWDAIGNFGGARRRDFLAMVGADSGARFIYVECADDYYESLDFGGRLLPSNDTGAHPLRLRTHIQGSPFWSNYADSISRIADMIRS